MLKNDNDCWVLRTKQLYDTAGLSYKLNKAGIERNKQHVNEVMLKLSDHFIQGSPTLLNKPGGKKRDYG